MGLKLWLFLFPLGKKKKKRQSDLYVTPNKFVVNLYSHLEGVTPRCRAVGGSDASAGRFCRGWHGGSWKPLLGGGQEPWNTHRSQEVQDAGLWSGLVCQGPRGALGCPFHSQCGAQGNGNSPSLLGSGVSREGTPVLREGSPQADTVLGAPLMCGSRCPVCPQPC